MLADFAITKPTVGGSSGTWGTELNAALDVLITHPGIKVVADATALAAYVPLLGQVLLQADTGKLYKCTNATGPVWAEVGVNDGVLTTQGDILIQGASSPARLGIGTAGQILAVNAGATAPEWKTVGTSPLTTKGDVYVYGSADARLPVGTNGQVLTADSAQALGVKWAPASGGGGGVPERWYLPASADEGYDDEFDDGSIDGWTAIERSGYESNWYEPSGIKGISCQALASRGAWYVTAKLKPLAGMSAPCYIETAILQTTRAFNYPGCGLIFADGTTYGAGTQVLVNEVMTSNYSTLARYTNFSTRTAFADIDKHGGSILGRLYIRLCWEAANTWSTYFSPDGVVWYLMHDSVSHTLTPTHFGISCVAFDNNFYDTLHNFAYFRARSGAPVNG